MNKIEISINRQNKFIIMVERVVSWKTSDGSLFKAENEATIYEQKYQEKKTEEEVFKKKQQEDYEALHQRVVKLYMENKWPSDHCNCDGFDYSKSCLVIDARGNHHLCTCESGICKRHTNLYFKNKGCFWCSHTDCSAHGC